MTTEISVMYGSEKVNQYQLYERSTSVILLLLKQTAYILCNMYTCLPTMFPEIRLVLREPLFNLQGLGFLSRTNYLKSSQFGGALKISNFITYRTALKVNYLFYAQFARNDLFQKYYTPPPPWRLNGSPLIR